MEIYDCSNNVISAWQYGDPVLRNITDVIFNLIGNERGKALDVGCGSGRVSILLAKKGFAVDAVDVESKVIDMARGYAVSAGVKVNFLTLDFTSETGSLTNDSYDLVVCSEVLEHVENYKRIISKMYKLLKRGGC